MFPPGLQAPMDFPDLLYREKLKGLQWKRELGE
jgi:hypothetical protein